MGGFEIALAFSAFIAGLLMFLAPCTLPLVPAYLAFISGVKGTPNDLSVTVRKKIQTNGLLFVAGFSVVFILFGMLAGFFGSFIGQYRVALSQVGGALIVFFGLSMLGVFRIVPLMREYKLQLPKSITPGEPSSAFLIGVIFALGWTPCVGPVLASVLLIASTKATLFSGAVLLAIFSAGLALPFLLASLLYVQMSSYIERYQNISKLVTAIGGIFLILIGLLLLWGNFGLTVQYGYQFFDWIGIGNLLDYY